MESPEEFPISDGQIVFCADFGDAYKMRPADSTAAEETNFLGIKIFNAVVWIKPPGKEIIKFSYFQVFDGFYDSDDDKKLVPQWAVAARAIEEVTLNCSTENNL